MQSFFIKKRGHLSPFLLNMNDLKETLKIFAEEYLTDGEHFLIDIERSTKNSRKYAVIIDGDSGVSIDFCSKLSRHISVQIDEEIGEDDIEAFTYEVTTPGVDRPLLLERQYPKHLGRDIKFKDKEGNTTKGEFKAIKDGAITVDVEIKEKGKKKPVYKEQVFLLQEISEPKIIVSFK